MNKSATQIMSRYTLMLYFHMKTALFLTILSITSCFSIDYIDCLLCCFSHNQRRSENRHVSQSAATERENQRRALFHSRQKPDIERVKRASVCPVWEGFSNVHHVSHFPYFNCQICCNSSAQSPRKSGWLGGTLSSVCGVVNGNVSTAETISVTARIHKEDLWLVGWRFLLLKG